MCKKNVILILTIATVTLMGGCGGSKKKIVKTGYLSDYSKLTAESDSSLRYLDKTSLASYSSFIVDRVDVHFQKGAKAIDIQFIKGKLRDEELADLTNYLHAGIVKAIGDAGFKVVYQPGPGVARMRAAITDIEETGASLEFEVVDSQTNRQIAAVIENKAGSRVPFTALSEWGRAKAAMDNWAKRVRDRLKEVNDK